MNDRHSVIENFILWYTSDENEREEMLGALESYLENGIDKEGE